MFLEKMLIVGPMKSDKGSFGGIQTVMNAYERNSRHFLENGLQPYFQESLISSKGDRLEANNPIGLIRSFGSSKYIGSTAARINADSLLVNSSRGLSLLRELRTIGQVQKKTSARSFLYLHHANELEKYLTGNMYIDREIIDRMKRVNHILLLSKKTRDIFLRSEIVTPERCSVLYPFHAISQTQHHAVNRDVKKPRIIYMGHLYRQKGIIDLVEAFRDLPGNFQLDICGDGDAEVRKYVIQKANESQGRMIYHGVVQGNKKVELYQGAMLFCLPSYAEGLPISMLEAMSCGCVPVVSNVGAIDEVIDQTNGFLVRPGDLQGIVYGLLGAYENWQTMSKRCAQSSKRFTVENHIKKLCEIVNDEEKLENR